MSVWGRGKSTIIPNRASSLGVYFIKYLEMDSTPNRTWTDFCGGELSPLLSGVVNFPNDENETVKVEMKGLECCKSPLPGLDNTMILAQTHLADRAEVDPLEARCGLNLRTRPLGGHFSVRCASPLSPESATSSPRRMHA